MYQSEACASYASLVYIHTYVQGTIVSVGEEQCLWWEIPLSWRMIQVVQPLSSPLSVQCKHVEELGSEKEKSSRRNI